MGSEMSMTAAEAVRRHRPEKRHKASHSSLMLVRDGMEDAVARFLAHLSRERGFLPTPAGPGPIWTNSGGSSKSGGGERLPPEQVSRDDIRTFLGQLSGSGFSRRSIARKLACLRTFLAYLCRTGRLDQNPALQVRPPKQERSLPHHFSVAEAARAVEAPSPNTLLGLRDRAMLELFYSSGIRLRELVGLTLSALDLEGRLVRVRGKGGKERLVPIGRPAREALQGYLQRRQELLSPDAPPEERQRVFLSRSGRALSPSGVQHRVERSLAAASGGALPGCPHPPAYLRDPPAGWRCGSECREGVSGTCQPFDDPDLYPCEH